MKRGRIPFMVFALAALTAGVWAGLVRMGWDLRPRSADLIAAHGPLMVSGFLGTVIGLERAVALGRRWGYLGPALTGLGVVTLIAGAPDPAAPALMTGGSLLLVAMSTAVYRRGAGLDTGVLVAGAAAWAGGNLIWLSERPIAEAVPFWAAFLVLTIVGERIDLSRLVRVPALGHWAIRLSLAAYAGGTVLTLIAPDMATRLTGVAMVALALWLWRYDVARRTVRQHGVTRFIAVCILSGAVWLAVSGVLSIAYGDVRAGVRHDALLHSLFLGFVFALIYGHAPIILPAVTGLAMRFYPAFYVHLVLLHASVLVRVAADLDGDLAMRRWSGVISGVSLILFIANTLWGVRAARIRGDARRTGYVTASPSSVAARR